MYHNQESLLCYELNNDIYPITYIDIINNIINWLNTKLYVVVYLNESKIPGCKNYDLAPMLHSQFIFGYNTKEKYFLLLNFSNSSQNIEVIKLPFSTVRSAFYDEENIKLFQNPNCGIDLYKKDYRIILLKYIPEKKYSLAGVNIDYIYIQLH